MVAEKGYGRRRHRRPPPRRGVARMHRVHACVEDADHAAADGNAGGRLRLRVAGEEDVALLVEEIDEDATQWARRKVGGQQPAAI